MGARFLSSTRPEVAVVGAAEHREGPRCRFFLAWAAWAVAAGPGLGLPLLVASKAEGAAAVGAAVQPSGCSVPLKPWREIVAVG